VQGKRGVVLARNQLLRLLLGSGTALALAPGRLWASPTPLDRRVPVPHPESATPLDRAYLFLDAMMDKYARGTTARLVQSFVPTRALKLGDIGYTYDNDLVVIALLQRGSSDDVARATVLGDSLLYGQAHDPTPDGRVRDGYHVNPYVNPDGSVNIAFSDGDGGSDVGNVSWTGLAFAKLYQKTGAARYLAAALSLGNWIETNAYDTRSAGGYTGGITQNQHKIYYKATEHNIDIFGLFTMLATFTGDGTWSQRAQHALTFLQAMWNGPGAFYWTGTGSDGVTINKSFIPEDVQSWSYLATGDAAHAGSIDWAAAHLAAANGPFSGVSFSNADTSGVWFEGTGHMAAALLARNGSGDAAKAAVYLHDIAVGQAHAPHADGRGIDAASKDGLRTGDGGNYFAALHTGATSWFCIAQLAGNPLRL
jgi:hypothetical protein